jgi:hypothetical protein
MCVLREGASGEQGGAAASFSTQQSRVLVATFRLHSVTSSLSPLPSFSLVVSRLQIHVPSP